jgi:hypothetical protein
MNDIDSDERRLIMGRRGMVRLLSW